MTLADLVEQIGTAAEAQLPLPQPLDAQVIAWANLHGWDAAETAGQRLLVRQAMLNAIIRQAVPGILDHAFATPLDALGVEAPRRLLEAIRAATRRVPAPFNFWGELYSALIPQAHRRRIGQFWTDERLAEWMLAWLWRSRPRCLADVGCGAGNFLLKAAQLTGNSRSIRLYGCDLSPVLLNVTLAAFLGRAWAVPTLTAQDYVDAALPPDVDAVICNPPYTRHHQIAPALKDKLQTFFKARLGLDVSRQATLALHFLLKLIAEMPDGAHAAVIVPMEVLDARYGQAARRALCQRTTLSALVYFSPRMNAFDKVDVGASILLFKKGGDKQSPVRHLTLNALPTTVEFLDCMDMTRDGKWPFGSLVVRPQADLLDTPKWFGLARPEPAQAEGYSRGLVVPLKALARVVRGIATGANQFFVLSTPQVKHYSLEPFVVRTLQRNREIQDIVLDELHWQALSDEGRGVWLLYLDGGDTSEYPELGAYLAQGEAAGYHCRSLVQTRKKWYAMEQRDIPPIFFTILTRGNPRFILNRAGVRPLNMFSLLYPNRYVVEANATGLLWALLNSHFSLSRLHSVSRTYGGNTLKVEPRELDNLPVINPLALPGDAQKKLAEWIGEFDHHRQAAVLIRHVDELVEKLLSEDLGEHRSPLPLQPLLLENDERYQLDSCA